MLHRIAESQPLAAAPGCALAAVLLLASCGNTADDAPGGNGGATGARGGSGGLSGTAGSASGAGGRTGAGGAAVGSGGQAATAGTGSSAGGVSGGAGTASGAAGATAGSSGQAGTSGTQAGTGGAAAGSGGRADGGAGTGAAGSGAAGAAGSGSGMAGLGGAAGTGGASANCSSSTLAKGDTNKTVMVGGTSRSYILHVPSSYTGTSPVPFVLDFHGLMGTGSQQKSSSGFAALSDSDGFVIAWPDGIDKAWNIGPCCTTSRTVDDLGFARAIVSETVGAGCIDTKRVYATGMSMGGGFSHYLACNAADIFAAAAPSAFDLLEEDEEPCHPSRPISVLSFRGTADTLVPYEGGASTPPNGCCDPIHFLGAVNTMKKWAELDTCTGEPTTSGSTQLYMNCPAGVQVGLYTIQGGGHAPGPAGTAWDFLKDKSLP